MTRFHGIRLFAPLITFFLLLTACAGPLATDAFLEPEASDTFTETAYGKDHPHTNAQQMYIDVNNPHEGSLWSTQSRYGSLFGDTKARNINDILTVNIVETTDVSRDASTKLSSKGTTKSGITKFLGSPLTFGLDNLWGKKTKATTAAERVERPFSPELASESENSYNGSGSTERKDRFLATLSARVINVYPNGNMLIKGNREITVNREKQHINLIGLVRPEDVSADNVVLSSAIADAKISITGKGVIAEKQSPGYGSRLYEWLWPFK